MAETDLCAICEKDVSPNASICPNCGHRFSRLIVFSNAFLAFSTVVAALILASAVFALFHEKDNPTTAICATIAIFGCWIVLVIIATRDPGS